MLPSAAPVGTTSHHQRPRVVPGAFVVLTALAAPVGAQEISLALPLDCSLGEDCYINDYVDRDPGAGLRDHACGSVTRDGHNGTDFALKTLAQMEEGVAVLAAAAGQVIGVRDVLPDISVTDPAAPDISGRECGNGVNIAHPGGWSTQYCHLKRGSVTVSAGDMVSAGTVLGEVGLSGLTTYPHVHMSLRRGEAIVDPFLPDMDNTCSTTGATTLWQDPPDYAPGGLISAGFATAPVSLADAAAGITVLERLDARDTPALVAWAYGYAGQEGDVIAIDITAPDGAIWTSEQATLGSTGLKLFLRFAGRRLTEINRQEGTFTATVTHLRGATVLARETAAITLD